MRRQRVRYNRLRLLRFPGTRAARPVEWHITRRQSCLHGKQLALSSRCRSLPGIVYCLFIYNANAPGSNVGGDGHPPCDNVPGSAGPAALPCRDTVGFDQRRGGGGAGWGGGGGSPSPGTMHVSGALSRRH